jgi:plastocyanin
MQILRSSARAIVAAAACAVLCAACGGLAHPISDDGACAGSTSPTCQNPGTLTLNLNVPRTILAVGDTETIGATFDGLTITPNGIFNAFSSDSTELRVGGMFMQALSVGNVTVYATYEGYPATVGIGVVANAAGVSASVGVLNTSPPAFVPNVLRVGVGSVVSFALGATHNLVFDPVAGAPDGIATGDGATAQTRKFTTAGTFTYQCTVHGETGVVNVQP